MDDFLHGVPDNELTEDWPGVGASPVDDFLWRDRWDQRMRRDDAERVRADEANVETSVAPKPVDPTTGNELRPRSFDDVIGQESTVRILRMLVERAKATDEPLDHTLLVGPSGTGKSTLAFVMAAELGRQLYQLEAPISHETLMELQRVMRDGDILFLDEIHQQSIMERRGKSAATQPEVLFAVMEDRRLPTATGVLPFPKITLIGATTDEGMLPDAFVNRFPLRPRLKLYSVEDLTIIAEQNADALDVPISYTAARKFALAGRGTPREVGTYVRNAAKLATGMIRDDVAIVVLHELMGVTSDGLTRDMQEMMTFLYQRCRRVVRDEVVYQASVNTIATAIGKSRDSKAVSLRVEPYLIERGYIQVTHGGRRLTDEGVLRAIALRAERSAA